jgi:hypothetical protein
MIESRPVADLDNCKTHHHPLAALVLTINNQFFRMTATRRFSFRSSGRSAGDENRQDYGMEKGRASKFFAADNQL